MWWFEEQQEPKATGSQGCGVRLGLSGGDMGFSPRRLLRSRGRVGRQRFRKALPRPGRQVGEPCPQQTQSDSVCLAGIPLRSRWPPRTSGAGDRWPAPLLCLDHAVRPAAEPPQCVCAFSCPPRAARLPLRGKDLLKEPACLLCKRHFETRPETTGLC